MEDIDQDTMDDIDQEFFSPHSTPGRLFSVTSNSPSPSTQMSNPSTPKSLLPSPSDPPASSPQVSNPSTPKRRHQSTDTHAPAIPGYLRMGSPVSRQASPTRHVPVASTPEKQFLFRNTDTDGASVRTSNTDHQDDHFNGKAKIIQQADLRTRQQLSEKDAAIARLLKELEDTRKTISEVQDKLELSQQQKLLAEERAAEAELKVAEWQSVSREPSQTPSTVAIRMIDDSRCGQSEMSSGHGTPELEDRLRLQGVSWEPSLLPSASDAGQAMEINKWRCGRDSLGLDDSLQEQSVSREPSLLPSTGDTRARSQAMEVDESRRGQDDSVMIQVRPKVRITSS